MVALVRAKSALRRWTPGYTARLRLLQMAISRLLPHSAHARYATQGATKAVHSAIADQHPRANAGSVGRRTQTDQAAHKVGSGYLGATVSVLVRPMAHASGRRCGGHRQVQVHGAFHTSGVLKPGSGPRCCLCKGAFRSISMTVAARLPHLHRLTKFQAALYGAHLHHVTVHLHSCTSAAMPAAGRKHGPVWRLLLGEFHERNRWLSDW